ncbi:MAG: GMC family oxidoreductase [Bdellovibrionota bacterium]
MNSAVFDYIIVGSGMGGSAAAYALTKVGKRVLLLEAGGMIQRDEKDWNGLEILVKGRYKSDRPIAIKQYDQKSYQPQGQEEVLGGKTMFYGGACFRLRENDFASWDLSYDDFSSWYSHAEALLEVHGEKLGDPHMPSMQSDYPYRPSTLAAPSRRIVEAAKALGLQPFRIPMAINTSNQKRPLCIACNTCDGFPCKLEAKNEAVTCFLRRADQDLLHIETEFIVDTIECEGKQAVGVRGFAKRKKKFEHYRADRVIVCAGAIDSAALLLRSKVHDVSGQLGRNLMRHCNSVVGCLFPYQTNPTNVFHKQVAISDLYEQDRAQSGLAAGVIQDIYMPPKEVLPYFVPFGIKNITKLLRGYIQNLLCITEDQALASNRVEIAADKNQYGMYNTRVNHQYLQSDIARNKILVKAAKRILRKAGGLGFMVRKIDSFSHAVGTARFGQDARTSVLDLDCRLHGYDNIFVLDGSFMPTSAGVNPSLTIAANALRVCHQLEGYQA